MPWTLEQLFLMAPLLQAARIRIEAGVDGRAKPGQDVRVLPRCWRMITAFAQRARAGGAPFSVMAGPATHALTMRAGFRRRHRIPPARDGAHALRRHRRVAWLCIARISSESRSGLIDVSEAARERLASAGSPWRQSPLYAGDAVNAARDLNAAHDFFAIPCKAMAWNRARSCAAAPRP